MQTLLTWAIEGRRKWKLLTWDSKLVWPSINHFHSKINFISLIWLHNDTQVASGKEKVYDWHTCDTNPTSDQKHLSHLQQEQHHQICPATKIKEVSKEMPPHFLRVIIPFRSHHVRLSNRILYVYVTQPFCLQKFQKIHRPNQCGFFGGINQ